MDASGTPTALTADALDELALRCGVPMRLVCARWSRIISDATLTSAVELANSAVSAVDRGDARCIIEIIITAAKGGRFRLARWVLAASAALHGDMLRYDRVYAIQDATSELKCVGASLLMADVIEAGLWFWVYPDYALFMAADDDTARRIIAACQGLSFLHAHISARRRDLIRRLFLTRGGGSRIERIIEEPDSKGGQLLRKKARRASIASWASVVTRVVDLDGDYVPLSACSLFSGTTCYVLFIVGMSLVIYWVVTAETT